MTYEHLQPPASSSQGERRHRLGVTVVSTGTTKASDASPSMIKGPISAFSTVTQPPKGCADRPGSRCFELSVSGPEKSRRGAIGLHSLEPSAFLQMYIKFEEVKQLIQVTQLNPRGQMQSGWTVTSQDTVSIHPRPRMESLCPSRARGQNLHLKMCPVLSP